MNFEGISASSHDGPQKLVAIMTSGGDSQGMNAAVRAVVRAGWCNNTPDLQKVFFWVPVYTLSMEGTVAWWMTTSSIPLGMRFETDNL